MVTRKKPTANPNFFPPEVMEPVKNLNEETKQRIEFYKEIKPMFSIIEKMMEKEVKKGGFTNSN